LPCWALKEEGEKNERKTNEKTMKKWFFCSSLSDWSVFFFLQKKKNFREACSQKIRKKGEGGAEGGLTSPLGNRELQRLQLAAAARSQFAGSGHVISSVF